MNKVKKILKAAIRNTIKTVLTLLKIVIPVILFVTLIDMTGILNYISKLFEPVMQLFGLPGEASLSLILGNVVNLYAAISVMTTLNLTSVQVTTLAIMLLFSHSLILETSILASIGVKRHTQLLVRITTMLGIGVALGFIIGGIYGSS